MLSFHCYSLTLFGCCFKLIVLGQLLLKCLKREACTRLDGISQTCALSHSQAQRLAVDRTYLRHQSAQRIGCSWQKRLHCSAPLSAQTTGYSLFPRPSTLLLPPSG